MAKSKTQRATDEAYRVAIHEAGHAVAAFTQRIAFPMVTIEPSEGFLGYCQIKWSPLRVEDSDRVNDRKLKRTLIVILGGDAAESHHIRRTLNRGSKDDFEKAFLVASSFIGPLDECSAYVNDVYKHTQTLLAHTPNWAAVKALAELLVRQRTVRYREARRTISILTT